MKTVYIDCSMGAAGDMLTAALLELFPDREKVIGELNALGIPGVEFSAEESVKCGITGTHMKVLVHGQEEISDDVHDHEHHHDHDHDHEHHHEHDHHDHDHDHGHHHDHDHGHHHSHTSMHDIEHIVRDHLHVSDKVREDIISVYGLVAQAESKVHGRPVNEIHFHEVGNMDAVADIAAVCYLLDRLGVDRVVASPVHVGSGQVRCAHGILPVPAPATAHILQDVPIYGGSIKGELCTPTGAALLKHFVSDFGPMPVMKTSQIGYGMGKKDFEAANCVRVMIGETGAAGDSIVMLSCNIDDMTGEEIGFAMDRLFDAGARDVFTTPVGMKKNRPGTMLSVICKDDDKEDIVKAVFKYTTTIGIREERMNRYVLDRRTETVETEYGPVRCKVSSGYGVERKKYEYDDMTRIAAERDLSLFDVKDRTLKE